MYCQTGRNENRWQTDKRPTMHRRRPVTPSPATRLAIWASLVFAVFAIPRSLQPLFPVPGPSLCTAPSFGWCEAQRACIPTPGPMCSGPGNQCLAWDNGCSVCRATVDGSLALAPPACAACAPFPTLGPASLPDRYGAPTIGKPPRGRCVEWNVPQQRPEVRVTGSVQGDGAFAYDIYVTGRKHEAVTAVFGDDDSPLCVPAASAERSHIGLIDGSSVGMDALETEWSERSGACVTDGASFVLPSPSMATGEAQVGHVELRRGGEGTVTLSVQLKDVTEARSVRLVRGIEASLRGPGPGAVEGPTQFH